MDSELIRILKNIPLFKDVSEENLKIVIDRLEKNQVEKDTLIFKQGDSGDCLMIIIDGEVLVYLDVDNSEDEKIILSTLSIGDYFGEMALITGEPRSANVKALSKCDLLKLDKQQFDQLIIQNPNISLSLSHMLSQRLKHANLRRVEAETILESKIKPSGDLSETNFAKLLQFCEQNSVTGYLSLENETEKARLTFEKGILQNIDYAGYSEDEAMDTLLNWQSGKFIIEPKPLKIGAKTAKASEAAEIDERFILIKNFIIKLFDSLTAIVGRKNLQELTESAKAEVGNFFPDMSAFQVEFKNPLRISFSTGKSFTEKDVLSIAVFIQTVLEKSRPLVVGMSYLKLQEFAGSNYEQLQQMSFFEYMSHSREFTGN